MAVWWLTGSCLGCAGFAKKKIFASKWNEEKWDPFRMLTQFFFPLLFASNFSLPIKAKLIERIFLLCFASKDFSFRFFFVLFSLHFIFVSLQMREQAKNILFASKRKNFASVSLRSKNNGSFLLPFHLISLHFTSKQKWWKFFASVSLHFTRSKNDGSFSLHFALKRKWWQFFASFLFCFSIIPFSFRFRFPCFASMRNKRKNTFFRIEAKLNFASISLRSKNDGTP